MWWINLNLTFDYFTKLKNKNFYSHHQKYILQNKLKKTSLEKTILKIKKVKLKISFKRERKDCKGKNQKFNHSLFHLIFMFPLLTFSFLPFFMDVNLMNSYFIILWKEAFFKFNVNEVEKSNNIELERS